MPRKGESIYHRKDGLWEARYVKSIDISGRKKYASVYAHSYCEVKLKRREAVDNLRLCQISPTTRGKTVSAAVEEWLAVNNERLRLSTRQKYQSLFKNHISKSFGAIPVIHCTTLVIQQFCISKIENGVSCNTVNSVLILLHSALKYANRVYNLPIPDIVYMPKEKKSVRVFSTEEQAELTRFLLTDTDVYKFGTLLALYTGLRIGELCALKWKDVGNERITVRRTAQRLRISDTEMPLHIGPPKTASSLREIPIPPAIAEIVNDFKSRSHDDEYVLSHKYMKIVEPRTLQYNFKNYVDELGLKSATFHTLRHSFATRCVEQGFEIKSLSEILGHSNVQITLSKYVHSSYELKAQNMKKLSLIV